MCLLRRKGDGGLFIAFPAQERLNRAGERVFEQNIGYATADAATVLEPELLSLAQDGLEGVQ
jgi:hypothetical protein